MSESVFYCCVKMFKSEMNFARRIKLFKLRMENAAWMCVLLRKCSFACAIDIYDNEKINLSGYEVFDMQV